MSIRRYILIAGLVVSVVLAGCAPEYQVPSRDAAMYQCRDHGGVHQISSGKYVEDNVVCRDGTVHTLEVVAEYGDIDNLYEKDRRKQTWGQGHPWLAAWIQED